MDRSRWRRPRPLVQTRRSGDRLVSPGILQRCSPRQRSGLGVERVPNIPASLTVERRVTERLEALSSKSRRPRAAAGYEESTESQRCGRLVTAGDACEWDVRLPHLPQLLPSLPERGTVGFAPIAYISRSRYPDLVFLMKLHTPRRLRESGRLLAEAARRTPHGAGFRRRHGVLATVANVGDVRFRASGNGALGRRTNCEQAPSSDKRRCLQSARSAGSAAFWLFGNR